MSACVEVNEAAVWSTQRGTDWWNTFRLRFERIDRIEVVTHSLGGDRVRVACDDRDHAVWLANHMVEFGGLPRTAVRAKEHRK